jgi:hypothetical protein
MSSFQDRSDPVLLKAATILSAMVQCLHIVLFTGLTFGSNAVSPSPSDNLDLSARVYQDLQSPARFLLPKRLGDFSDLDADVSDAKFLGDDKKRGVPACGEVVASMWTMPAWVLPSDNSGLLDLVKKLVRHLTTIHHINLSQQDCLFANWPLPASDLPMLRLPCSCVLA